MAKNKKSPIGKLALIVSGFPRSGTSTLMRMLYFGGIDVLAADEQVEPDSPQRFNPYGSYELKNLKDLEANPDLVESIPGHAIKIVCPYMQWFPFIVGVKHKCIMMLRDRNEIISSLMAMRTVWEHDIADSIRETIEILTTMDVPIHRIHYKDMITYPRSTALGIADFLQEDLTVDLDIDEMVKAVDLGARRMNNKTDRPGGKLITFDREDYDSHIQLGNVLNPDGKEVMFVKNADGTYTECESIPDEVEEKAHE